MQAFAVFAAVLAAASANPQFVYNGLGYSGLGYGYGINGLGYAHHGLAYSAAPVVAAHAVVAPAVTKSQYHAQDELGQASFGHSEPGQAHAAVRDAAGGVRGTFSYISPEGKQLTTHYVADHNGYRVASNNLPVAPQSVLVAPVDTPEVQAAKAQHFAAVAEASARSGRKKRGIAYTTAGIYGDAVINSAVVGPAGYGYTSQVVSSPVVHHAPAIAYSNHVVHAPSAVTYAAAAPAVAYSSHVVAAPAAVAAPAYGYSTAVHHAYAPAAVAYSAPAVVAAPAVRAATLTKVVNTPGHAVSYRVD